MQENLVATADLLTGVEYLTLMPQSQHIRRDNDQRCDTTKAGRAGQTSGLGLGRPGRFGHQPYIHYMCIRSVWRVQRTDSRKEEQCEDIGLRLLETVKILLE